MYYQVTSLVARDWLESIVRLLTDPPEAVGRAGFLRSTGRP
jgi:hypothetical protein